jgi:hypothetical protein
MGLAFSENGCTIIPFFEPCPYIWEGEIFHSSWNLEISFFPKKICKNLSAPEPSYLQLGFLSNKKLNSLEIPQELLV